MYQHLSELSMRIIYNIQHNLKNFNRLGTIFITETIIQFGSFNNQTAVLFLLVPLYHTYFSTTYTKSTFIQLKILLLLLGIAAFGVLLSVLAWFLHETKTKIDNNLLSSRGIQKKKIYEQGFYVTSRLEFLMYLILFISRLNLIRDIFRFPIPKHNILYSHEHLLIIQKAVQQNIIINLFLYYIIENNN